MNVLHQIRVVFSKVSEKFIHFSEVDLCEMDWDEEEQNHQVDTTGNDTLRFGPERSGENNRSIFNKISINQLTYTFVVLSALHKSIPYRFDLINMSRILGIILYVA